MKLRLEAEPQELKAKGDTLLKALAAQMDVHNPELAKALRKALEQEREGVQLRHQPLRDLHAQVTARYQRAMTRAQDEINAVLDESIK